MPNPKRLALTGLLLWAFFQPFSNIGLYVGIGVILLGLISDPQSAIRFFHRRDPLASAIFLYVFCGFLSFLFGGIWWWGILRVWREFLMIPFFYILSIAFSYDEEDWFISAWSWGFVVAAILGISQFCGFYVVHSIVVLKGSGFSFLAHWLDISSRAHGSFGKGSAVLYGELMAFGALGMFVIAIKIGRNKWRYFLPSWLCVAGLVLSQSRGPALGFLIGLLCVLFLEFKSSFYAAIPVGAFLLGAIFSLPRFSMGRHLLESGPSSSINIRLELWKVAWEMFLKNPIFGVGLRNYGYRFHSYHPGIVGGVVSWGNPHNLYLFTLAEQGLTGFFALIILLGTIMLRAWKNYRSSSSASSLWLLAWMFTFLVMDLTNCSLDVSMIWMPTIALYAWMESRSRLNEGRP